MQKNYGYDYFETLTDLSSLFYLPLNRIVDKIKDTIINLKVQSTEYSF